MLQFNWMSKIIILMIVALVTASGQCVATCSLLPCHDAAEQPAPVSTGDCHHEPPPAQHHSPSTICGHQVFLSEANPQVSLATFDELVVDLVAFHLVAGIPETLVRLDTVAEGSPPPLTDRTTKSILRV